MGLTRRIDQTNGSKDASPIMGLTRRIDQTNGSKDASPNRVRGIRWTLLRSYRIAHSK